MLERWRAALEAGVEMVVTGEYELAGSFLSHTPAGVRLQLKTPASARIVPGADYPLLRMRAAVR